MHGDRVVVRIARIEADGRADGEIVKVLKRAHPTVVGEFRIGRRGQYVVPHDDRIQQWIEIPEGMEIPPAGAEPWTASARPRPRFRRVAELEGMIVNVELLDYPKGEPGGPRDRDPGPARTISEWMSRSSSASTTCRTSFPPEAVEQAAAIPHVDRRARAGRPPRFPRPAES